MRPFNHPPYQLILSTRLIVILLLTPTFFCPPQSFSAHPTYSLLPGGVSVYGKWVHNFLFHPPNPTQVPTESPTDIPTAAPTYTEAPTASPKPTHYPTFYKPPQAPNVKPVHINR